MRGRTGKWTIRTIFHFSTLLQQQPPKTALQSAEKHEKSEESAFKQPAPSTSREPVVRLTRTPLPVSTTLSDTEGTEKSIRSRSSSCSSQMTVDSCISDGTGRKRPRSSEQIVSDESDDSGETTTTPAKVLAGERRGRGRPPTTGQYVGVGKLRAEAKAARERQQMLDTEDETVEIATKARPPPRPRDSLDDPPEEDVDRMATCEVLQRGMDGVAVILEVAAKSGNLKGTAIKALKDAAALITKMLGGLYERNTSEDAKLLENRFQTTATELKRANAEITRISAENIKLREDLGGLRRELELVREELKRTKNVPSGSAGRERRPTTVGDMSVEELRRLIIDQAGTMVSARIEGLARRLPPEERLRPPLEADKRRAQAGSSTEPIAGPSTDAPITSKGRKSKKKEARKARANAQQTTQPAPPNPSAEEDWVTVTKRGRKTKTAPKGNPQPSKGPLMKESAHKPKKKVRLRPPKSGAVVLKLRPEAIERGVSYSEVLTGCKGKIDPAITRGGFQYRSAATGARLIEVAGEDIEERTEKLLERIKELVDPEVVEVLRPMKTAAFRISGLDDAVEAADIRDAVSKQGGCQPDTVVVSEIRQSRRGMGTAVVRCPIAAAKKLTEEGRKRLLVGWVSAAIHILPSKPLRCYKCHEVGHVVAKCDRVDRSALCLRCGGPNHKAKECTAAPHCMVCAAAGTASNHVLGGKSCKPPQRPKRRKTSGPAETSVRSGDRGRSHGDCRFASCAFGRDATGFMRSSKFAGCGWARSVRARKLAAEALLARQQLEREMELEWKRKLVEDLELRATLAADDVSHTSSRSADGHTRSWIKNASIDLNLRRPHSQLANEEIIPPCDNEPVPSHHHASKNTRNVSFSNGLSNNVMSPMPSRNSNKFYHNSSKEFKSCYDRLISHKCATKYFDLMLFSGKPVE
ncbi:unnamed protein product [Diatraea saccharalis]|uniref:CCHC-type domain-containing protein n=1 Tax=Diatraea saccharalis TaxID=40085 RepID=A0A9N9RBN1_9NEOP|nr:unnamed protein product [Diatraea saccharalis]